MYNLSINFDTLKTRWFRILFVVCCVAQVIFFYLGEFYLWASGGFGFWLPNLLLIYWPALIILTILTIVGLRLLLQPPIPRPWQVHLGIFVAILVAINSGIVSWVYNNYQIPYLFYYPVFVALGLLVLDGYMLQFIVWWRRKHPSFDVAAANTPGMVQQPSANRTSKKALILVVIFLIVAQLLTAAWVYSAGSNNKHAADHANLKKQCRDEGKYQMVHGYYQNGQEYMRSADGFVGVSQLKNAKYHCYSTLDEVLKDYPNFYSIVDKYDDYKKHLRLQADIDQAKVINEAQGLILSGPIGKKYLRVLWITQPASSLKLDKVVIGSASSDKVNFLPWRADYISKSKSGTISYACAESDNPLLMPAGINVNRWQTEITKLDRALPEVTRHNTEYYPTGNQKTWIITYRTHIVLTQARNTRCVLNDANGLITKEEGDVMVNSVNDSLERYFPAGSEEGQVIIDKL